MRTIAEQSPTEKSICCHGQWGVTTSNVGDAPMLPDLLEQIPPEQEIAAITADPTNSTTGLNRFGRNARQVQDRAGGLVLAILDWPRPDPDAWELVPRINA